MDVSLRHIEENSSTTPLHYSQCGQSLSWHLHRRCWDNKRCQLSVVTLQPNTTALRGRQSRWHTMATVRIQSLVLTPGPSQSRSGATLNGVSSGVGYSNAGQGSYTTQPGDLTLTCGYSNNVACTYTAGGNVSGLSSRLIIDKSCTRR